MKLYTFRKIPFSIIRSSFTVHSAMVYVIQVCRQLSSRTSVLLESWYYMDWCYVINITLLQHMMLVFRWFIPVVRAYKYIGKWVCTSNTTIFDHTKYQRDALNIILFVKYSPLHVSSNKYSSYFATRKTQHEFNVYTDTHLNLRHTLTQI